MNVYEKRESTTFVIGGVQFPGVFLEIENTGSMEVHSDCVWEKRGNVVPSVSQNLRTKLLLK